MELNSFFKTNETQLLAQMKNTNSSIELRHSGYLKKKGDDVIGLFRKRWFMLKDSSMFFF